MQGIGRAATKDIHSSDSTEKQDEIIMCAGFLNFIQCTVKTHTFIDESSELNRLCRVCGYRISQPQNIELLCKAPLKVAQTTCRGVARILEVGGARITRSRTKILEREVTPTN